MRREGEFSKRGTRAGETVWIYTRFKLEKRGGGEEDFKYTYAGIATSLMHREYGECTAVDALQNYEYSREQRVEFLAYGSAGRGGRERTRRNRRKNRSV